MLNNFIYAQTKDLFLDALNAGNVLDEAVVFIEDTKEIWNHGHYFAGGSGSGIDPNIISEIQTALAQLDADKLDSSTAESTYAKKSELPNLSSYLTKATADTLYATISQYNTLNQTVSGIQTELTTKLTADDLDGYAKISDLPPTVTDATVSGWDYMKKTAADGAYAPKSLVETVSDQATAISGLATKDELSTGLSGKLDSSAANGFVPTTRKVNGVALSEDITITATDPNAATKTELNNLSTNLANNYVTNSTLSTELDKKQGVISDLATIRSGAAAGATALQSSDLDSINESISDIETALSNKAESSALSSYATANALSSGLAEKQATLVSGTNIKTIEGQSILGSGDIQITAANVGAYTTGEIDSKITAINNSIAAKADPSSVTAVSNRVTTLEGYFSTTDDSDATINKWKEIVAFLEGVSEGSTVESLLAAKANQSTLNELQTNLVNNYALKSAIPTNTNQLTNGAGFITADAIPTSYAWGAITGKPTFATVATSGKYSDLSGLPTIPSIAGLASETWVGSNYLPLSGGTISGTSVAPLIINTSASDSSIVFRVNSTSKTQIGYNPSLGSFIYNYASEKSLGVKDDGTPHYNNHTLIHSGNIGSQHVNTANCLASKINDLAANDRGGLDCTHALYTGGWASSDLGYASTYGTYIDLSGYSSWYHRLAFNTTGEIEHFMGINTTTLTKAGSLAYLSSNVASATKLATPRTIWGQSFDGTGDVSSTLYLPNNIAIASANASGTNKPILRFNSSNVLVLGEGTSTSGYNTIIQGNNIQLQYGTSNTNGLVLKSSGNVGIGTTSPSEKLSVAGNITTTGNVTATKFVGSLQGNADTATTAANASKVNGYSVSVVSSMPSSPDANTIYYVTG